MCPPDRSTELGAISDCGTDCSIDEERAETVYSHPCENGDGLGFRQDFSADGASAAVQEFSEKVKSGQVEIGDYGEKARLTERLAGGSFGEVYIGEITSQDNKKVAVKVEAQGSRFNFLLQEGNVYRHLEGGPGIPKVYWFGYHGPQFGAMIMDLLGPTLEHVFTMCKRKFSLSTVLMLADQMLDTLEYIHKRLYVHRDISPSNFVLGCEGNEHRIYLIDFGHAKKYQNTFKVLPRRNSVTPPRAVVGTPRFISVHSHLGHDDGPRDDLESLGYILLYLLNSALPWQGIKASNMPEKLGLIAEKKINIPVEKLCKGLPEEFASFFNYVRSLKLYEPIDYQGIKHMFKQLAKRKNMSLELFDWEESDASSSEEQCQKNTIKIAIPERLISSGGSAGSSTPPSR